MHAGVKDELMPGDWQGRISELRSAALQAFWVEALGYARYEISRYACWRGQGEPVLPGGYDAESVVQAAFERLMRREAFESTGQGPESKGHSPESTGQSPESKVQGPESKAQGPECTAHNGECGMGKGVPIVYTAEDIRRELRAFIKHRVRWLHERSERRLVVSEWDAIPPKSNGELVSIFDCLPGRIESPDRELMRKEKEQLLGEFKRGFEGTLGKRKDLLEVFERVWDGEKRREVARERGVGVTRVKASQAQLHRRLARFSAEAQGGVAEMLEGVREEG